MNPEILTVTLNPAIDRTVTIPRFAAGEVNRVESERSCPGGKGVNVAAALADLGVSVAATGFLGRENAACFESLFDRKGIDDRFVRINGATRVGIKITDPALNQTTDINFPGPAPDPGDLDELRERIETSEASWIVLAGSLPPGVPVDIYRSLGESLEARGRKVAVDTSGDPLPYAIEAQPALIKPNLDELEALVGRPLNSRASVGSAAAELAAGGVELVVVSMGADGACFATRDEVLFAVPPKVKVGSTVGAGDAMVAGALAGRFRGLPLAETARLATASSLRAIAQLENETTLEALMQSVTIQN